MRRAGDTVLGAITIAALGLGLQAAPRTEVVVRADLTGTTEVPGPGDPDGIGRVSLRLLPDSARVCFEIVLERVERPAQAHVHAGAMGNTGPPVLTLTADAGREPIGCVTAEPAVLSEVAARPSRFYVNVHSAAYRGGAVRGQLALAPVPPMAPQQRR